MGRLIEDLIYETYTKDNNFNEMDIEFIKNLSRARDEILSTDASKIKVPLYNSLEILLDDFP